VYVFVRIRISPPRIKLAASHFARRFIYVQGRESQIFVNFAPLKPKIGRIDQRAGHAHRDVNITAEMRRCKHHARDAPFRRIGMCGYRSVPVTDVLVDMIRRYDTLRCALKLMGS